jgi:Cof subfamily protein (haloacid dehalogenase superfamily)
VKVLHFNLSGFTPSSFFFIPPFLLNFLKKLSEPVAKVEINELKERLKNIKLVACDIDGTLLSSDNKVGEGTIQLVNELKNCGVKFTLITGRVHSASVKYAKILGVDDPIVSLNGALVKFPEGETIKAFYLPEKKVLKALELAEKFFVNILFYSEDKVIYTAENTIFPSYIGNLEAETMEVDSYYDYTDKVLRVVLSSDRNYILYRVAHKLEPPFFSNISTSIYPSLKYDRLTYLEVKRRGISKATGLKYVRKFFKLKRKEIAGIGDFYNDVEFLKSVGVSVAMKNAVAEVKFNADYVTTKTNDEDGVAEFLEILLDSKKKTNP